MSRAGDEHLLVRPLAGRLQILDKVASSCCSPGPVSDYRRLLRESLPPEALRRVEPLWARLEELDDQAMKISWAVRKILKAVARRAAKQATAFDDEEKTT